MPIRRSSHLKRTGKIELREALKPFRTGSPPQALRMRARKHLFPELIRSVFYAMSPSAEESSSPLWFSDMLAVSKTFPDFLRLYAAERLPVVERRYPALAGAVSQDAGEGGAELVWMTAVMCSISDLAEAVVPPKKLSKTKLGSPSEILLWFADWLEDQYTEREMAWSEEIFSPSKFQDLERAVLRKGASETKT